MEVDGAWVGHAQAAGETLRPERATEMSHSLSVVIVNFNSGHHLSACLGTVVENLESLELQSLG